MRDFVISTPSKARIDDKDSRYAVLTGGCPFFPPTGISRRLSILPLGAFLKNAFGYLGDVLTLTTPANFPRRATLAILKGPSVPKLEAIDAPPLRDDVLMTRSFVPNSRKPA